MYSSSFFHLRIYIIKGSSPIYLVCFPDLGLYVYASTAAILHDALERSGFLYLHYEVIDVEDGEIVKITSDGVIERCTFVVNEFYFTQRTWGFDSICREHSGKPTADDGLEDFLDICGYFGMTEDDIMYLLEMGYSYDEIEEFLWNPRLYEREVLCSEI